jgi:hypothetical protein
MRTTLTIDPDVAVQLQIAQKLQHLSFKQVVNESMRRGLAQLLAKKEGTRQDYFKTEAVDLGECSFSSLDNIADTLSILDGESYK